MAKYFILYKETVWFKNIVSVVRHIHKKVQGIVDID